MINNADKYISFNFDSDLIQVIEDEDKLNSLDSHLIQMIKEDYNDRLFYQVILSLFFSTDVCQENL